MNSKDFILQVVKKQGEKDALQLRKTAATLSGTEIIKQEYCIPNWNSEKDYSNWPIGSPVKYNNQVWTLFKKFDKKEYIGFSPEQNKQIWNICHTKDYQDSKLWVEPSNNWGLYKKDECYKTDDGKIFKCIVKQSSLDASNAPNNWEEQFLNIDTWQDWDVLDENKLLNGFYQIGDKITYNNKHYICKINNCDKNPDDFPDGWELVS